MCLAGLEAADARPSRIVGMAIRSDVSTSRAQTSDPQQRDPPIAALQSSKKSMEVALEQEPCDCPGDTAEKVDDGSDAVNYQHDGMDEMFVLKMKATAALVVFPAGILAGTSWRARWLVS